MLDNALQRQLARLIGVRAVIATVLLGGATWAQIADPGSFPMNPFFFLIGLTYGLTVAYALTLRFVEKRRWLVDVQIAGDALIVSAFIYFTGGVASFFTSLYGLPIIGASLIQYKRGGFLAAALSTTIYVGLVLLQYLTAAGLLHDPWLIAESVSLPPRSVAQYTVALNVSGFF